MTLSSTSMATPPARSESSRGWTVSSISRSHRQGSAGSGVKDQPEPCQTSGDAGTSSITRNTTSLGGDERTRTADPLLAKQVLYQLSYVPASPGDAGNVAENSPRLQHPWDIQFN